MYGFMDEALPRFSPNDPQSQLLFECHRAARLLLRLQMHQRPRFEVTDVSADMHQPPFVPVPGQPGAVFVHRNVGTTRGQGRLLNMLSQNDGVFIKDIVDAFDIRPSSASELVTKLEKQGLVRVESDEEDKRARKVFLTDKGKEAAEKMRPNNSGMFDGLTSDEQNQLLSLLEKMNSSLAEKSQELDRRAQDETGRRQNRQRDRRP